MAKIFSIQIPQLSHLRHTLPIVWGRILGLVSGGPNGPGPKTNMGRRDTRQWSEGGQCCHLLLTVSFRNFVHNWCLLIWNAIHEGRQYITWRLDKKVSLWAQHGILRPQCVESEETGTSRNIGIVRIYNKGHEYIYVFT